MVTNIPSEPDMLAIAHLGFHVARVRLNEAVSADRSPHECFVPAMEALYWAMTLDEQLSKLDPKYRDSEEPGRRLMHGMRYARNQATHALPLLLERSEEGLTFPLSFPLEFVRMTWKPVEDLPVPERPSARQERCYRELLEGETVRKTLDRTADWFSWQQQYGDVFSRTIIPLVPSARGDESSEKA
ncbi:hypothetical protein [Kitasatospora purpeofusca]|uniref:hypothetical protein n=1 Tax=Kitasatospora purpeofusca TaxID=67352 RepID=UPI0038112551